jgi:hypothetical protein
MAHSYSGDPSKSDLDMVRFRLQDVDPFHTDEWFFEDEEIEAALTAAGNMPLLAAERLARTLGARFSRRVTFSLGGDSKNYSDLAQQFFDLADQIKQDREGGHGGIAAPLSEVTAKDNTFRKDMMTIQGCETEDNDGVAN